jgi:hypothetical protein
LPSDQEENVVLKIVQVLWRGRTPAFDGVLPKDETGAVWVAVEGGRLKAAQAKAISSQ